jgi:hypothetical protein
MEQRGKGWTGEWNGIQNIFSCSFAVFLCDVLALFCENRNALARLCEAHLA